MWVVWLAVAVFIATFAYTAGRKHAGGALALATPRIPLTGSDLKDVFVASAIVTGIVVVLVVVFILIIGAFGVFI